MSTRRSFLARFTGFVAAALVLPRPKAKAKPIDFGYGDVTLTHSNYCLTFAAGQNLTLTTGNGTTCSDSIRVIVGK